MRIIEVGPRDGLQNERALLPTDAKIRFIEDLLATGLTEIEATSFVSPKWVPQLADAAELWAKLPEGGNFSALVPNPRGLESALAAGCKRIALFTAASSAFTQKNINMTVEESLDVFAGLIETFRSATPDGWVRGYVSTVFECPFSGKVSRGAVEAVVDRLATLGVDEVSLGDTIGVAVPAEVKEMAKHINLEKKKVAWHFHDTRGTAIANVAAAFELGFTAFDSSAGGLGGCPYAPGAGGNLATEDLVYFLERSGVKTGVNAVALAEASLPVLGLVGRQPMSKAQTALLGSRSCVG